jgi:large-conductance mechanosensitive channel
MSDIKNGISNLKQFIADNNIVGTSAGVCVALAAKDVIQSLVGDIIIPSIIILLHTLHIDGLAKYLPAKGTKLNITDFIKEMITFFLIIIITFVFIKFAFGYLLGVDIKKQPEKTPEKTPEKNSNNTMGASAVAGDSNKDNFDSMWQ